MRRVALLAVLVGVILRLAVLPLHGHPRGDVQLDVGVAASLVEGHGFGSGFERGTALMQGTGPIPVQDRADQHAPLWPVVGALLSPVAGAPLGGLKLGSLLFGVLLMALVWRLTDRLTEDIPGVSDALPALGAALVGLSFVAVDFSANGALHMAQGCGIAALVLGLTRPRPSVVRLGLLCGLLALLHHSNLLLGFVPAVVLLLAAGPTEHRAAVTTGLGVLLLSAAVQAPWWWRNAQLFGDPFYSVNGLYLMYRSGVEPELLLIGGTSVLRFPEVGFLSVALQSLRLNAAPNLIYLFVAGLCVWPGLMGVLGATAGSQLATALRRRQRLVLACWVVLALLAGLALIWPAAKLRFCAGMLPLVVPLGLRGLALPDSPGTRRGAWVVTLLWLGLLAATFDDVTGGAPDARPWRWLLLAGGGLLFGVLPALLRRRLPLAVSSGLIVAPVALAAALLPWPHTSYHSTAYLPDIFDQAKERDEERTARGLAAVRGLALERGAERVAGPLPLIAWPEPAVVTLPLGEGTDAADEQLRSVLDDVDHVIVELGGGWWSDGEATVGQTWLDGQLRVVGVVASSEQRAGFVLSEVVR